MNLNITAEAQTMTAKAQGGAKEGGALLSGLRGRVCLRALR
jgi:hypothetical protein